MANWYQSEINISGSDEDKEKLINTILDEEGNFSFKNVIPLPSSLDIEDGGNMQEKISAYLSVVNPYNKDLCIEGFPKLSEAEFNMIVDRFERDYGRFGMYLPAENLTQTNPGIIDVYGGKPYVQNMKEYDAATWYHYCYREWGTKWDVENDDVAIIGDMISFATANGEALPVVKKLAELNPDVEITFRWSNEDYYCGQGFAHFKDGQITEYFEYPTGSMDGVYHYAELHNTDIDEMIADDIISSETISEMNNTTGKAANDIHYHHSSINLDEDKFGNINTIMSKTSNMLGCKAGEILSGFTLPFEDGSKAVISVIAGQEDELPFIDASLKCNCQYFQAENDADCISSTWTFKVEEDGRQDIYIASIQVERERSLKNNVHEANEPADIKVKKEKPKKRANDERDL